MGDGRDEVIDRAARALGAMPAVRMPASQPISQVRPAVPTMAPAKAAPAQRVAEAPAQGVAADDQ